MESGLFLGIDHGGTTTTALLYEIGQGVLGTASVPIPKTIAGPGLVEHDARDFLNSSLKAAHECLQKVDRSWSDILGVGIANQGETSIAWSARESTPIGPALSWEDRRTLPICRALAGKGVDGLIRQRTGITLDPYFSASKFYWLLHEQPQLIAGHSGEKIYLGGTDSYVIHALTGEHSTDPGTASRTALFDIRKLEWDAELLSAFGVHARNLPYVKPTVGDLGRIGHAELSPTRARVTADVVDAHAALFAQGCTDSSAVKATYGTGAFIEVNTGRGMIEPDGKLPVFIAWQLDDRPDYTLEGGVYAVGSAIDWAVRTGLMDSPESSSKLGELAEASEAIFVPSFSGIAAPHWAPEGKALVAGIGLDTTSAQIVRALLDGIAFSCAEVVQALNVRLGGSIGAIKADGGPSRNGWLMQRQADLCAMPVIVSEESDMTALGAALLAAIGAGQLTLEDVGKLKRNTRIYEPRASSEERESEWHRWKKAVAFVRELAER